MKKIAIVTATRAEYGLLAPVIKKLRKFENESLKCDFIVTGTHLSDAYGMTVSEIETGRIRIDHKVKIPVASHSAMDISKNQAETVVKFTELFGREQYNAVILLGDRYETLSIAIAAGNTRTPIFHLCGGDTTEGAMDEWIRHSISKMSYLHFVTNEESRRRVIQLGEHPDRVFNYGSTSIDNILTMADMTKSDVLESIGLKNCRYAICTYHPVTMENESVENQIAWFTETIKTYPQIEFIVTKSNADQGGAQINNLLDEAETVINNLHVFASLGVRRYLSLMKYAEFVLGNSSSGIIETPAFHIPTVNIGNRQRGRLHTESIIDCAPDTQSICYAIAKALSSRHKEICQTVTSPYGDGHAAGRIAQKSVEAVMGNIDLKKKFYDLEFVV